jgi:hypothetical protein
MLVAIDGSVLYGAGTLAESTREVTYPVPGDVTTTGCTIY